jgi:hypothetical protein
MNSNQPSPNEVPLPLTETLVPSNQPPVEIPPTQETLLTPTNQPILPSISSQQRDPLLLTQISISSTNQNTSSVVPSTTTTNNPITQSQSLDISSDEDGTFIPLYHEEKKYYILKQYSQSSSSTHQDSYCRFPKRFCVVSRTKIRKSGTKLQNISETVFSPDQNEKKQMGLKKIDTAMVTCFLPTCMDCVTNQSKTFHFCCYAYDVTTKQEEGLCMAQCTGTDDVLLDHITDCDDEMKNKVLNFSKADGKLVFPLCTKRCYNSLLSMRNKHKKLLESNNKKIPTSKNKNSKKIGESLNNFQTPPNWDRDGGEGKKSSIVVLVDWLTTEENITQYYGGLDTEGNTSANRKNAYHKILS